VGHPPGLRLSLLDEVTRLAEDLLRPRAEQVDRTSVPRSHLDALGRAGALALTGPPELGGVDRSTAGQVVEVVAGACAATWFVMTQHMTPVAMLTQSANAPLRDRLLPLMCTGEVLSGIAIAHLRRPDPPAVVATRIDGGWSFDGAVDWMTSWGICDVFLLCGRSADDVVFALVPALVSPGLAASPPQELLAMQATTTVSLSLRGYVVADEDVVAVQDYAAWAAKDRDKTADVSPAVFGLQREIVRLVADRAPELAAHLGVEADRLRSRASALSGVSSAMTERLSVRAAALELCLRSATALVTVTGGSAMRLNHPAQRHLREAAFLQVQGQTPALRDAAVALLLGD
jgi:alkylation response protein AidB-like acyl-CoA dehydrogenase